MYSRNPNESFPNTKYLKVDFLRPNNSLNENTSSSKEVEVDLILKKSISKDVRVYSYLNRLVSLITDRFHW